MTPFEMPDAGLAVKSEAAGAFAVLHLGRDAADAKAALNELTERMDAAYGVCIAEAEILSIALPKQVSHIILPWGMKVPKDVDAELCWQVHSVSEAEAAIKKKAKTLILKGSEGAGLCGDESSFLLFQALIETCKKADVALYIQGGTGVHTAAAYLSLGADGVILDSQLALMPECGISANWKAAFEKMNGSEIRSADGFRYFLRPGAKGLSESASLAEVKQSLCTDGEVIALGQDVILSVDYAAQYRRIEHLVRAVHDALRSQLK
jgi:NAD(P)H-dependent flavin oxidoreductase YrpB (nitropropane dioxygenase family)